MPFPRKTAAALLLAVPLFAAHAEEGMMIAVDGVGGANCTNVLSDLKAQPAAAANAYSGWALGYMTRRNIERARANQSQVDFAKVKLSQETVLNVIVGICEKNPEASLITVVDAIYKVVLEDGALTS